MRAPPSQTPEDTHLCCLICCMENLLAGSYSSIPEEGTTGESAWAPAQLYPTHLVLSSGAGPVTMGTGHSKIQGPVLQEYKKQFRHQGPM